MKIIAIGDIHGKDCWKKIAPDQHDKIIFIGDYVDAKDISRDAILENLKSILEFKRKYPSKVVLLLGNHDIQYLHYPDHRCSGFDRVIQPELTKFFNDHKSDFQIAWQYGKQLFVHAGLSRRYFDWLQPLLKDDLKYDTNMQMDEFLNRTHENQPDLICVCGASRGGLYPYGGPLWGDAKETKMDHLEGLHQIVGHSRMFKIEKYTRSLNETDSSITYIDVLDQREEFYEVEL
jgi:Calcineurin-like phosphoesterase